jgi:hypothetical protein
MLKYSMKLAGLAAFAASAVLPAPALAQSHVQDPQQAAYDLLMDCVTLQILFGVAAQDENRKNEATNMGVAYLSAIGVLTGKEIKDLGPEVNPRRERILGWISSDNPNAKKLTMACAAIFRVGKDYNSITGKK